MVMTSHTTVYNQKPKVNNIPLTLIRCGDYKLRHRCVRASNRGTVENTFCFGHDTEVLQKHYLPLPSETKNPR